jgi:hypothetical protein
MLLIVLSIPLLVLSLWVDGLWVTAVGLFVLGWIFQFLGHAIEGKPPELRRSGDGPRRAGRVALHHERLHREVLR